MALATTSKPAQFHHENESWRRLLDFFTQENSMLKNRLAEVVDHRTDKAFLALAEHFQNKFILKDEYIQQLKRDINLQDVDMVALHTAPAINKLIKRQEELRNELEYFEKDFNSLKNEFNKYLSSVL